MIGYWQNVRYWPYQRTEPRRGRPVWWLRCWLRLRYGDKWVVIHGE